MVLLFPEVKALDDRPIGVFDSGVGGLTVVKELMEQLPGESIIYFGDTARVPYGSRSADAVTHYSLQCIRFLMEKGVKSIIVACNTASAMSMDAIRATFDIPVIGVIESGARAAAASTKNGSIGIIGTEGTIATGAYQREIKRIDPGIILTGVACPLFVPIVEEGWSDSEIAYLTARKYLSAFKGTGIDTLVLGCTHYPLLFNTISKVMGPGVTLVNPAKQVARATCCMLKSKGLISGQHRQGQYEYYASDSVERFQRVGTAFLKRPVRPVERVDINRY